MRSHSPQLQKGFTLMEIVIVAAIIAIGSAVAVLSWPDTGARLLQREGDRLSALLESARVNSRASGQALVWQPTETGFVFRGNAPHFIATMPNKWLNPGVVAHTNGPIVLGPEPLLPAQSITLRLQGQPQAQAVVKTDGLAAFSTQVQQQ